MHKIILIVVILVLASCKTSKPQSQGVVEFHKGILLSVGKGTDFYFVDSVRPTKNLNSIFEIVDTTKLAKRYFVFLRNIKDSLSTFMKPFPDDLYVCGEWDKKNELKFLFVTIEVLNKEGEMNSFWKKEYSTRSDLCIFSAKFSRHSYLKFRNANMEVRAVRNLD